MKKLRENLSAQIIVIVTAILLAVNLALGARLVSHSKAAMKDLIQSRMLDISNTAADMLDGDVLKSLSAEDKGTAPYQAVHDTLAVFQKNIALEYIYTIRDVGNRQFIFMIDPALENASEFGEAVFYTDALYTASLGTPAVDEEPYTDAWGRFYSAYSPVFDSDGGIAAIVAVDFSAQWYDEQISRQTRSIAFNSFLTVLLGIALTMVVTRRLRRQLQSMIADISELSRDVNDLTQEIRNDNTQAGFQPSKSVRALSEAIHTIKEELGQYVKSLHAQANSMITALASDYRSVYYIDLDRGEGVCYQALADYDSGLQAGEHFAYQAVMERYANDCVTEPYREAFLRFIDPDAIRAGLEKERLISYLYMVRRGGAESYETVRFAGVRHPEDRDDHIVHAVGMGFTDVDAETRKAMAQSDALRAALVTAEAASRAKTAFLSNMSHEIRTPMNAIIGLDNIALADGSISESTRDHLEKIGLSARHLLGIINDILDMSRIESGRMTLKSEEFSFAKTLEQINTIIGGQCRDKGDHYECRIIGQVGNYYIGDDMKLRQVMINILGNAVKFTPEGGSVTFRVETSARYNDYSTLRFIVSDTGVGMSKEYLPRIFDAFSQEDSSATNKYGSTGLGMPITKSIVELMNGAIEVESEKGRGTTFTVTLTLQDSGRKDGIEGAALRPQEMCVLVIDDDSVACEHARLVLREVGIECETALSGAEGLEMVKIRHARREPYHLIVVDWKMPDLDGVETTRQIRSVVGAETPIIILTSYNWDDVMEEAKAAGVDAFVSKPLFAGTVIEEFHAAFAKKKSLLSKAPVELSGKHVLLAEDVAVNAEIITMLLSMRGMTVDRAENGRVAVELFAAHEAGYYDAILMDMRMPEMDGLEATRSIRAMDRTDAKIIPIIALTANAFDEDVQRSMQAGLNAHLSKPVQPETLFETLESLIRD